MHGIDGAFVVAVYGHACCLGKADLWRVEELADDDSRVSILDVLSV